MQSEASISGDRSDTPGIRRYISQYGDAGWDEWDLYFKDFLLKNYSELLFGWREAKKTKKRKAKKLKKKLKKLEPLYLVSTEYDLIYPAEFGIHIDGQPIPGPDDPSIHPFWEQFLDESPIRRVSWEKFIKMVTGR